MGIRTKLEPMGGESTTTVQLSIYTDPADAICTLSYDGATIEGKVATVEPDTLITYTISHSTYGTSTGTILMDTNKVLTCTGKHSGSSTELVWTQPALSSNTGNPELQVYPSTISNATYDAWKAFDKDFTGINSVWCPANTPGSNEYIIFTTLKAIKISNITCYSRVTGYVTAPNTYTYYYGTNESDLQVMASGSTGYPRSGNPWSATCSMNGYYNYFKLYFPEWPRTSSRAARGIQEIVITATYISGTEIYYWDISESSSTVFLEVITDPLDAVCTLTYYNNTLTTNRLQVLKGGTIEYSVSHSIYGTSTGSVLMNKDKTLICTGKEVGGTVETWTQPKLSSNTGNSELQVYASSIQSNNFDIWKAFDKDTITISSAWSPKQASVSSEYIILATSTPINISGIIGYSLRSSIRSCPDTYTYYYDTYKGEWSEPIQNGTNTWYSITYGNNKFVAVGISGYIATSTDGITWDTPIQIGSNTWFRVSYIHNKFIAVGSNGYIATSTDGISWSSRRVDTIYWRDIAYNNGTYVIVGNNGYIVTSTDGTTWSTPFQVGNSDWYSISYGDNNFVALNNNGYIATSTDGTTWDTSTQIGGSSWLTLIYGNNKFVAVGTGGYIATSTDGITWDTPIQVGSVNWHDITYGNNKFIAVGNNGHITVSIDGTTWATPTQVGTNYWMGITYANNKFIIAGIDGYISLSSSELVPIASGSTGYPIEGATWDANCTMSGYYNYFKLYFPDWPSTGTSGRAIQEIVINATYLVGDITYYWDVTESSLTTLLNVITTPASATCTLTYNGISYNTNELEVDIGSIVSYSVYDSVYGYATGNITMDTDKTLTCTGTSTTSTVEYDWTQPILSSNGTMGSSAFACAASTTASTYEAWKAFDGTSGGANYWCSTNTGVPQWIAFYTSQQIKISQLYITNRSLGNYAVGAATIQGSNDYMNWTDIGSYSCSAHTGDLKTAAIINYPNYYSYHRIYITGRIGSGSYITIGEISITAKRRVTVTNYSWNKIIEEG